MFADALAKLRGMTFAERIDYVQSVLGEQWSDEEHAQLVLILAHALRRTGQTGKALKALRDELPNLQPCVLRWRLLGLRAWIEVEQADDVAALGTLEEMEGLPVHNPWLGEYYGVKARALSHQGNPESFAWYRRAIEAHQVAGSTDDVFTYATWAALTAIDRGSDPSEWLDLMPEGNPYRFAILAELALSRGETDLAAQYAGLVHSDADTHAQARAKFVEAMLAADRNGNRASILAEEALSLATATRDGYEPRLVARILAFRDGSMREEVVN